VACKKDGVANVESWLGPEDIAGIIKSSIDAPIIELRIKSNGSFKKIQTVCFNTSGIKEIFSSIESQYNAYRAEKEKALEVQKGKQKEIERLAENGNANSQYQLSEELEKKGLSRDAFKWCKLSAEGGNTTAMVKLVRYYHLGIGTLQDSPEALMWANIANVLGDERGNMSMHLLNQEGVYYYDKNKAKKILSGFDSKSN
jgi:hypothetical protein